ncbi:MAG: hypothetical protein GY696_30480 [Gammaproteobacteria bacterium]|nr:hypothetical protein [Gammaproteobacteria bacterium]
MKFYCVFSGLICALGSCGICAFRWLVPDEEPPQRQCRLEVAAEKWNRSHGRPDASPPSNILQKLASLRNGPFQRLFGTPSTSRRTRIELKTNRQIHEECAVIITGSGLRWPMTTKAIGKYARLSACLHSGPPPFQFLPTIRIAAMKTPEIWKLATPATGLRSTPPKRTP